jgi:hypothetical protein
MLLGFLCDNIILEYVLILSELMLLGQTTSMTIEVANLASMSLTETICV